MFNKKPFPNILNLFGDFILLEIDTQGRIIYTRYNNTEYKTKGITNIKEMFSKAENKQISRNIKHQTYISNILKTNKDFGNMIVEIKLSRCIKERRYILINFSKTVTNSEHEDNEYIKTLIQESELDHMTQTLNRKGGWRKIEEMLLDKEIEFLGIIFVDIDGLKKINDEKGHMYGDKAIIQISELLKKTIRQSDLVMRFGGDEFVIVVSEKSTSRSASRGIATRILKEIKNGEYITTVSIGIHVVESKKLANKIAEPIQLKEKWTEELQKADEAVYESKQNGRCTYSTTSTFKKYFKNNS